MSRESRPAFNPLVLASYLREWALLSSYTEEAAHDDLYLRMIHGEFLQLADAMGYDVTRRPTEEGDE